MSALSAARGVSQVMNRCEDAKVSGCLDLSNCELLYLADALYMVLRDYPINICSLKNNKLKKFPLKLITNFPHIAALNVEGNSLVEIPDNIGELVKLRGINLSKNQLKTFPQALFHCQNLSLLDISHNEIEEISIEEIFTSLPSLKQLNMSGNPFIEKKKDDLQTIIEKYSKSCKIII